MYYYLGILGVCGLMYRYRYRLLLWGFSLFVRMMGLYVKIKNRNKKNNHLQFVTADQLSDDVVVCHYHGLVNEKEHNLKVIKNAIGETGDDDDVVIGNILQTLESKNNIVHCSIVGSDEDTMLDLTSVFREFVYHFERDDEMSKMEHFFKYVTQYYDLDNIKFGNDDDDLYFVIYLNDDTFTEVKYKVKEINNHQFREVLRIKQH